MTKELEMAVNKSTEKIKGFDKLSKRHQREIKRKLLRKAYKSAGIKHSGNFSPAKPFNYKGSNEQTDKGISTGRE